MPIVAIANQKGGVGKTTSTINIGAALHEAGKRVLLVDLDPQGNLSVASGVPDPESAYPTVAELLTVAARGRPIKGVSIQEAIVQGASGMDVLPSNSSLSGAELQLVSAMNRESALANVLKPVVDDYDYILIDCLPSLGLLAINALRAANGVIIPVQADFLAMQGLAQIIETIAAVRENLNPDLRIYGVLLTMVDPRTAHAREVVDTVRATLEDQVNVFNAEVRLHVVLKETAKLGRTILDFAGDSPAAEAYRHVGSELMSAVGDAPSAALPPRPPVTVVTDSADEAPEDSAPAPPAARPPHSPQRAAVSAAPANGPAAPADIVSVQPAPAPSPEPVAAPPPTAPAPASTPSPSPAPAKVEAAEPTPATAAVVTDGVVPTIAEESQVPARQPGLPFAAFVQGREKWLGHENP